MMVSRKLDWLAYAVTGKEFIAMDDMKRLDIDHWRGTRVEFERRGKARTADPYDYPALHNYIWIRPTPAQVSRLRDVRFLGKTFHMMGIAAVREFSAFRDKVDAKEAEAREIVAHQEEELRIAQQMAAMAEGRKEQLIAKRAMIKASMQEYRDGQMIEIRDGILAGEMAKFKRLIIGAEDVHPFIEAEMEMMGRVTTVRVDPLAVRRAVGG